MCVSAKKCRNNSYNTLLLVFPTDFRTTVLPMIIIAVPILNKYVIYIQTYAYTYIRWVVAKSCTSCTWKLEKVKQQSTSVAQRVIYTMAYLYRYMMIHVYRYVVISKYNVYVYVYM